MEVNQKKLSKQEIINLDLIDSDLTDLVLKSEYNLSNVIKIKKIPICLFSSLDDLRGFFQQFGKLKEIRNFQLDSVNSVSVNVAFASLFEAVNAWVFFKRKELVSLSF